MDAAASDGAGQVDDIAVAARLVAQIGIETVGARFRGDDRGLVLGALEGAGTAEHHDGFGQLQEAEVGAAHTLFESANRVRRVVGQLFQDGVINGRLERGFTQSARDLHLHSCAWAHQDNAFAAHGFLLLEHVEVARATDPVITAKALVGTEVAHRFAEITVRLVLDQRRLFRREVDRIEVFEQGRRARKAELGRFQPLHHA